MASHESMLAAVKEVVDESKPIRAVAKRRGIPKSTLFRKVAEYKDNIHADLGSIFNKCKVCSSQQEKCLAQYLSTS